MYNSCHIQSRHIDGHVTLVQVLRLFTQRSDVFVARQNRNTLDATSSDTYCCMAEN